MGYKQRRIANAGLKEFKKLASDTNNELYYIYIIYKLLENSIVKEKVLPSKFKELKGAFLVKDASLLSNYRLYKLTINLIDG